MKNQKRKDNKKRNIGLSILLTVLCLSAIGTLAYVYNSKGEAPGETVQTADNANSDAEAKDAALTAGNTNQPQHNIDNRTGMAGEALKDLEDYSEAPADNGQPYYVKVNRQQNVVTVYALDSDGYYTKPVKAMVCSVGKDDGTPTGTYETSDKHTWCSLVGGVYGQYAYRIDGQIMFHSVPYYSMNKGDLETEEYNKLGEAASLGCIRLAVADAKWIYDNCPSGTLVTIYDSPYEGPLGKPVAEILDTEDIRSKWDPTDPDTENPWIDGSLRILGAGDRQLERGCTYQLTCGVLALDGEGNDITDRLQTEGTVDASTVGEYTVTYRIRDAEGNQESRTGILRVVDTIAPELQLKKKVLEMNRAEASEANCIKNIKAVVTVTDMNDELSSDCLEIDIHSLEGQKAGRFPVYITATDAAGNVSKSEMLTVKLDRISPEITEPEQKEYHAASEQDLKKQLEAAFVITDNYSGVDMVQFSWVWSASTETYSILVTARDGYGNVTSQFYDNYIFSFE